MFKNMKIWMRFLLGFGAILVFMVSIIIVDLYQTKIADGNLERIMTGHIEQINELTTIGNIARDNSISMRNILLLHNDMILLRRRRTALQHEEKSMIRQIRIIQYVNCS